MNFLAWPTSQDGWIADSNFMVAFSESSRLSCFVVHKRFNQLQLLRKYYRCSIDFKKSLNWTSAKRIQYGGVEDTVWRGQWIQYGGVEDTVWRGRGYSMEG